MTTGLGWSIPNNGFGSDGGGGRGVGRLDSGGTYKVRGGSVIRVDRASFSYAGPSLEAVCVVAWGTRGAGNFDNGAKRSNIAEHTGISGSFILGESATAQPVLVTFLSIGVMPPELTVPFAANYTCLDGRQRFMGDKLSAWVWLVDVARLTALGKRPDRFQDVGDERAFLGGVIDSDANVVEVVT